jgi:hypothetical protein
MADMRASWEKRDNNRRPYLGRQVEGSNFQQALCMVDMQASLEKRDNSRLRYLDR